jgi:RecA/RadA recombinase
MEMEERTGRKLYTKGEALFIMVVEVVGHCTRRRVLVGKMWDQAVKEQDRYHSYRLRTNEQDSHMNWRAYVEGVGE